MTRIGLLLFPQMTVQDLIGPYEVFCNVPDTRVDLVWHTLEPVQTEHGLLLTPTATCDAIEKLDVLCVPGGDGVTPLLEHAPTLSFIQRMAAQAQYVTSVCTGALLLGAAGLLKGRKATTYWSAMSMLPAFGAIPVHERVVQDGHVITGGGVTAGIDFGLYLVAQMAGPDVAQAIQLGLEYNPAPPFDAGHPSRARPEIVKLVEMVTAEAQQRRWEVIQRVTAGKDAPC